LLVTDTVVLLHFVGSRYWCLAETHHWKSRRCAHNS